MTRTSLVGSEARAKALRLKGMAVNEALVALKAGQDARLLDLKLPHEQKPGMRKEERLRAFLDQISRAIRRQGSADEGRCVGCAADIDPRVLDEAPWQELCASCSAREEGLVG